MESKETNHSRRVRRILNGTEEVSPAMDWNLRNWLPVGENRVQFIINKEFFHGVVCIDNDFKNSEMFNVGYVDFLTNTSTSRLLVHQSELFGFVDSLRVSLKPHRAPKCEDIPSSPEVEFSF